MGGRAFAAAVSAATLSIVGLSGQAAPVRPGPPVDFTTQIRPLLSDAAPAYTGVSFIEADVRSWRALEPFDAIVGRLILFHLSDPASVVRHHSRNLRPGGRFMAIDFDLGGARTEPDVPLADEILGWLIRAFEAAGASPFIGARLGPILAQAGLRDVTTFGVQGYLQPGDPMAARLLAGVARSLAGAIVAHGVATVEQLGHVIGDWRAEQVTQGSGHLPVGSDQRERDAPPAA